METPNGNRLASLRSHIYTLLAEHQRQEDWDYRDESATILSWVKRFNGEFKLLITEIALRIENLPIHIYSLFREGYNGHGLRGEITINLRHFGKRPLGLILASLLHQVVHAWQHEHGRPAANGRHNREYRRKAAELGLVVTKDGKTGFVPGGPFEKLISGFGFGLPVALAPPPTRAQRPAGNSKLKKWTCGCTIARVAITDFRARCLKPSCGNLFACVDGPTQAPHGAPPAADD